MMMASSLDNSCPRRRNEHRGSSLGFFPQGHNKGQVGMFLRMLDHPEPAVAAGMTKRLEKRWNDYDQPLLLALILNPFELSCFGPKAGLNHFNCLDLIVSVRHYLT
jgi:hypothetical protein